MNTLAQLYAALAPVLGQLGALLVSALVLLQPTLTVVVPSVIALLAHRYISNKAVADAVATSGGVAYSRMSSIFAASALVGGKLDFGQVKLQAIVAGTAALSEMAQRGLSKLTEGQKTDLVNGALGKLLAADPAFSVTGHAPATKTVVQLADSAVAAVADVVTKTVGDLLATHDTPAQTVPVSQILAGAGQIRAEQLAVGSVSAEQLSVGPAQTTLASPASAGAAS